MSLGKQINKILNGVKKEILPVKEKETLTSINTFLKCITAEAKRLKIQAKPFLGGSFAKDTWLNGDYDVDVFFAFDTRYKNEELSVLLGKVLEKFCPIKIHGSRDYFQIRDTVSFEIIPVYAIKKASDAKNVTDFSLWHVAWVNKKGKTLKDEIRLAKKFCKAQRVYGAESYLRGFSGHVLDILVICYGGFIPFLKAVSKWEGKIIIDTENRYKGNALRMLNTSKTEGPVVVVDPVQPDRNAAAAISLEQFDCLRKAASAFMKKPSNDFFIAKPVEAVIAKKKGVVLKVVINPVDGIENVVGVKLVKVFEWVKRGLQDFKIAFCSWEWDKKKKAVFWFVVKKNRLEDEEIIVGPPIKFNEHVSRFKRTHAKTFVKNNRVFARVAREVVTPDVALKNALQDGYVKDKIVQWKIG